MKTSNMSAEATVREGLERRPLLDVRELVVDFHGSQRTLRAVDHVSLQVNQGGSLGIVGESGSGKSMTARAIMGLLAENATWQGDITFDGANLRTLPSDERRRLRGQSMAMIFQDPLSFLNPVLTVGGQIAEALYYR
jgi:ABC-type glutathione transport system ATPase component